MPASIRFSCPINHTTELVLYSVCNGDIVLLTKTIVPSYSQIHTDPLSWKGMIDKAWFSRRFAPLATLVDEVADQSLNPMVTHFNKKINDTTAKLIGKQRRKRKTALSLRSLIFVTKHET